MIVENINNPSLGFWEIFGFEVTWRNKIFFFVKRRLEGLDIEKYWKHSLVDQLIREYLVLMAKKYKPVEFSTGSIQDIDKAVWDSNAYDVMFEMQKQTGLPFRIVDLFCRALYFGAHTGHIPYAKWNPHGYEEKEELRQSFESEQAWYNRYDVGGKAKSTFLMMGIFIVGGVVVYNLLKEKK